ncbi:FecR family protein [Olivibacter domesticus]|uniref:FecR family protein n=1 Tax=Olivibacter domesticus TaxID=407022 RepID=A0A1H7W2J5_OLID1|nr:FecR family protein [Olivibacter domesticus]SEM15329.1 FecR family protein [Olivibacter domesticus]
MDPYNQHKEEERALNERFEKWYNEVDELHSYTEELRPQTRRNLRSNMLSAIKTKSNISYQPATSFSLKFRWKPVLYAASIILVFTSIVVLLSAPKKLTYKTAFGQIKQLKLPDGSLVKLNGNSSLVYHKYSFSSEREVWIKGEGTFQVVHRQNNQPFRVHVSDSTYIDVLGTEFNVRNRTVETLVALRNGKINFRYNSKKGKHQILIHPGQYLSLTENSTGYRLKDNAPIDDFFIWQQYKLVLNHGTLSYVLSTLSETYGLRLKVTDSKLLERDASGSLPLNVSHKEMISNIALLYDLNVMRKDDQFLLLPKSIYRK